MSAESAANSRI